MEEREFTKALDWPPFEPIPSEPNGSDSQSIAPFELRQQLIINRDHKIWKYITPGDRIEVLAIVYAPYDLTRGWEAAIRVFKEWNPSSEMTKFLYAPCRKGPL